MSPVLVAFEGVDASGKSTQARRIAERHQALFAFEPGDTEFGVELRRWVLDGETVMNGPTEALVMLADRAHHVAQVVGPALRAGRSVVADRYVASTLAYQGYGRGVDLAALRAANALAVGPYRPTITILLDVDLGVANERRSGQSRDRFEGEDSAFFARVREGYLALAAEGGWALIDGSAGEAQVAREVDELVADLAW